MECDVSGGFLRKDRRRGEVPSNDDALTSGELLDLDFLGRKSLKFRSDLLDGKGRKPFLRKKGNTHERSGIKG